MNSREGAGTRASWATSEASRATMKGNVRRDTRPELAVRKRLHAAGLRYRVDYPALASDRRRRADIVFTRRRLAVFIDGCFWHGCPEHFIAPRANAAYWGPKIERNRVRDLDTTRRLEEEGWRVLRFWEHEAPASVVARIILAMRDDDAH